MSMIRLLHLVASSGGGGATHVRDLAVGLPRDRFETTVAMPLDAGNVSVADFTSVGAAFEQVHIAGGFAAVEVLRLSRLLKASRFDIVHVHGARASLYGRLAAVMTRPRPAIVFSIHGFAAPFYPLHKRLAYLVVERVLQAVTDVTICVAQAEADSFLSFGLTDSQRVRVIPYGIDVSRFLTPPAGVVNMRRELGVADGLVVLTVCRLNVPRDFLSLLTAFRHVRDEFVDARLLIVGDGPQRDQVEQIVQELGLERCVRITGFRDDVPAFMALADVYVLTSYGWEGYPISTLEAQAAGVPVVVTDAGGSAEAVQHEKTGLVVPKRRPDLLADALLRLLRNPGLREQMAMAGQQRARQEFARERMIQSVAGAYHSCLLT